MFLVESGSADKWQTIILIIVKGKSIMNVQVMQEDWAWNKNTEWKIIFEIGGQFRIPYVYE